MRPDIVVEYVATMYLFSGETDAGREWLTTRRETTTLERIGRSIAVQTGRQLLARPTFRKGRQALESLEHFSYAMFWPTGG